MRSPVAGSIRETPPGPGTQIDPAPTATQLASVACATRSTSPVIGSILRAWLPSTTHTASFATATFHAPSILRVTSPDASSTLTTWSTGGSTWIHAPPKPYTVLHAATANATKGGTLIAAAGVDVGA